MPIISAPHGTYIPVWPATDSTSSDRLGTSRKAKLSRPWNSFCTRPTPGEACTNLTEAAANTTATWGMSNESYFLSRLNELAQYRDIDFHLSPTDPQVERMLEDFKMSEIEDWRFDMDQFDDVVLRGWEEDAYYEAEMYEAMLLNSAIMLLAEKESQERLLDEALLEDLERYEEEEEEFWTMRGVAQMYGMWDEEYWQTWCGPRRESACNLGHEDIEASFTFQAEHSRDIEGPVEEDRTVEPQIHEVFWWGRMRSHDGDGQPTVIFWQELPRGPNRPTEPRKPIHEMGSSVLKAMERPEPDENDPASSDSECGQNSVYLEFPEEDPDWVKPDEREYIALPPPPSPTVETFLIEIPKIPEPEIDQDEEAWTLIVPS